MYAVVISAFFALYLSYYATDQKAKFEFTENMMQQQVSSGNFTAYREALINYINANPAVLNTNGTIADGVLTFLPGYIRDAGWSNYIFNRVLYVYGPSRPGLMEGLYVKSNGSLALGYLKGTAAAPTFVSSKGLTVDQNMPAALGAVIPINSIVMIGK